LFVEVQKNKNQRRRLPVSPLVLFLDILVTVFPNQFIASTDPVQQQKSCRQW
jgi:hypothetical protein